MFPNHRLICKLLACLLGWLVLRRMPKPLSPQPSPPIRNTSPNAPSGLGASPNGMRNYVLVVLKTGPNKVPAGA